MTDGVEQLLAAFKAGPAQLRDAIRGMTPNQLSARPIADKWTTQEVVCHLADFEIINAERIQRTIAEENPTVFDAHPDPRAERLFYDRRDCEAELQLIESLRRYHATILDALEPQQWQRTLVHSGDGPLTLRQLVERTTVHIQHHVRFIAQKRAAMAQG